MVEKAYNIAKSAWHNHKGKIVSLIIGITGAVCAWTSHFDIRLNPNGLSAYQNMDRPCVVRSVAGAVAKGFFLDTEEKTCGHNTGFSSYHFPLGRELILSETTRATGISIDPICENGRTHQVSQFTLSHISGHEGHYLNNTVLDLSWCRRK